MHAIEALTVAVACNSKTIATSTSGFRRTSKEYRIHRVLMSFGSCVPSLPRDLGFFPHNPHDRRVSAILITRRSRQIFPARAPSSGQKFAELRDNMYDVSPGYDRTAYQQAGFQLLALVVTLGISIVSGLITGMCVIDFRVASILGARERREMLARRPPITATDMQCTCVYGFVFVHPRCAV